MPLQRDLGRAVGVEQAVGFLEGVGELRVAEAAEQRGVDHRVQQRVVLLRELLRVAVRPE